MNDAKQAEWKKPELEEIPLSCEITSYSSAELPEEILQ
jgi:coenzyme PQQ precursor peptide PqqA